MDCIWARCWINFLLVKQFRSDMLQGGVRMCTDIQLSCQLAVSQARKALPCEAACGAYAIWKENLFHAWFNGFFKRVYLVLLSQKLLVLQSFIEKLTRGWYSLKFLIRISQFERIWHLVFQVSFWIAYFYWTFSYF